MPPTNSLDEVAQALVDVIKASAGPLGLKDVWYGEEDLVPKTPAVSVVPDRKRRDIIETGYMARNDFEVVITLFHSRLASPTLVRRETIQLAEQLEDVIHADRTLGGLLVHSYVTELTPGFVRRGNVVMKATQLGWSGFTKTRL